MRHQDQGDYASITCMIRHYVARRAQVTEGHPHNADVRTFWYPLKCSYRPSLNGPSVDRRRSRGEAAPPTMGDSGKPQPRGNRNYMIDICPLAPKSPANPINLNTNSNMLGTSLIRLSVLGVIWRLEPGHTSGFMRPPLATTWAIWGDFSITPLSETCTSHGLCYMLVPWHDGLMAQKGVVRSRAAWWWSLLLVTAVGIVLSLTADHLWGGTAAGIIATIFFAIVAILFGLSATKLATPGSRELPLEVNPSPHSYQAPPSDPSPKPITRISSSFEEMERIPHETRLTSNSQPSPGLSTESDDWLDSKNRLVERLARSIPDEEYIAQVADEAGLEREHLRLSGTPSNRWSSVIRRAEIEKKEERVVERASRISPDEPLQRAIQDYIRRRP